MDKNATTAVTHSSLLQDLELIPNVLAMGPQVAVFDCDGTLWKPDSGYGFMTWSIDQGLVSRSMSDWIDSRYRLYRAGEVSELAMCGEMVQLYSGLREEELRQAAKTYFEQNIAAHIFPRMLELVQKLNSSGAEVWAVSSTNNWVVEVGVERFGIPASRVLAAEVRSEDGLVTETLVDVPTDEGKAESLKKAGVHNPDAVFGNSIHDAAMLEMARTPYAINPSPALLERAAREGWNVHHPLELAVQ